MSAGPVKSAPGRPRAVVVVFPGSNGDRDLYETFEHAGFAPSYCRSSEPLPRDVQVVGLPGGFSYGDYWRAGMLASQARAMQDVPEHVARGGLVIGICNGFQILVESDLLPGALRSNDPPGFRHKWVTLEVQAARPSPWFDGIAPGTRWRMPMAHGEGNYFHAEGVAAVRDAVPVVYSEDVNGSLARTAALLDPTGRVLGIMPHPDRSCEGALGSTDGLAIFHAARRALGGAR